MKFARINLKTCQAGRELLPEIARDLNGKDLLAYLWNLYGDIQCGPLSPDNRLIFTSSISGGPGPVSPQRLYIGAKSPVTGVIKDNNAGGNFAVQLGRLGFRALVLEGALPDWGVLVVSVSGIGFVAAADLIGKGTKETVKKLQGYFPDLAAAAVIGPAGEKKSVSAAIALTGLNGELNRFAARGGLGAVMGAKKLKAIVLGKAQQE